MIQLHLLTGKSLQNKIEGLLRSTKRPGIERVISFLADRDFYTAPASTRFHGNHKGGLAEHSYNVYLLLNKKNIDYELKIPQNSVIISGLLHDICKVGFYTTGIKNIKNKDTGKWEQTQIYQINDKLIMGHGAKSVYMLQNMIRLSVQEAMMIRWHMGPFANEGDNPYGFNDACQQVPAVCAIYTSDMEASNLFETVDKV